MATKTLQETGLLKVSKSNLTKLDGNPCSCDFLSPDKQLNQTVRNTCVEKDTHYSETALSQLFLGRL